MPFERGFRQQKRIRIRIADCSRVVRRRFCLVSTNPLPQYHPWGWGLRGKMSWRPDNRAEPLAEVHSTPDGIGADPRSANSALCGRISPKILHLTYIGICKASATCSQHPIGAACSMQHPQVVRGQTNTTLR